MIAALFDVDGTLYTANMWRGLMSYANSHGRKRAAQIYYLSNVPSFYLKQWNLISEESFRRPWVERLGWMAKGWSNSEGDAAWDWIVNDFILPTARNDVIAVCQNHIKKGHAVVLVSAMLMPCLERIGRHLGVIGVVGTGIEFREGRYTGRTIPPVIMGIEKDNQTRRFFASRGIEIDWGSSYAYADSISDSGLFNLVGNPIAVYPDSKLRAFAMTKSWKIIDGSGAVRQDAQSSSPHA